MKLGFIGLGKMGSRMAEKLLAGGHELSVWNRTQSVSEEFQALMMEKNLEKQLTISSSIEALSNSLSSPKIIWLMLPAGDATQNVFDEVEKYVSADDIVIDGGNANWEDTQRRFDHFTQKGVKYLGIGVSGGIIAFEEGYPLMAGGDGSAYELIQPILETLSKPHGGYDYFGTGGAGHFVKMVHNAIEYSYMQGIGEGFGVLENAEYKFDLGKVANLYRKNTLVSGFMMDRTAAALKKDPKLEQITGVIGKASGETIWTIDEAKKHGLLIENIEQALEFRNRSENDEKIQKSFAARLVSALRREFGGHAVKEK